MHRPGRAGPGRFLGMTINKTRMSHVNGLRKTGIQDTSLVNTGTMYGIVNTPDGLRRCERDAA